MKIYSGKLILPKEPLNYAPLSMPHLSDFHIHTPRTGSVHLMIYRAYDYVKLQDRMVLWIKLKLLIN